jgi:hypothetical protein
LYWKRLYQSLSQYRQMHQRKYCLQKLIRQKQFHLLWFHLLLQCLQRLCRKRLLPELRSEPV